LLLAQPNQMTTPSDPTAPPPPPAAPPQAPPEAAKQNSPELLTRFFSASAAAKTAAKSLKRAAEVGVQFTDAPGDWHFSVDDGTPRLLSGKPRDADFALTLAPGATRALAARADADVGDLGILFFQHMVNSDPNEKIRVHLHSGLLKLTMRGYLGVLASGGPKVIGWMAQKGLKGPSAIAAAISRLKKG
jgi:hypothetical protein